MAIWYPRARAVVSGWEIHNCIVYQIQTWTKNNLWSQKTHWIFQYFKPSSSSSAWSFTVLSIAWLTFNGDRILCPHDVHSPWRTPCWTALVYSRIRSAHWLSPFFIHYMNMPSAYRSSNCPLLRTKPSKMASPKKLWKLLTASHRFAESCLIVSK